MSAPTTRYAKRGDISIAYQVFGDADLDLVYCAEFWNSIEAQWMEPRYDAFLRDLASFTRLITFDQAGTGLSDPLPGPELPPIEEWTSDIEAVMDAARSSRAALLGSGSGAAMGAVFAALNPHRISALVLLNGAARLTRAADYPWGSEPQFESDWRGRARVEWGRGEMAELLAPSAADDQEFRAWWARVERMGLRPGMNERLDRMALEFDIRPFLPAIRVPTLVITRPGNRVLSADHGRYLAQHIGNARYVELSGRDYLPFIGDAGAITGEIREFLTGTRVSSEPQRVLGTLLFTDIVGSTERAVAMGDRAWRDLLERHNTVVRSLVRRFHGREIDTAGDSFLVVFERPGDAIQAAQAIRDSVTPLGLEVRCGIHTGEIERVGREVRGIAVHIGARVAALAGAGEILVTSTVKDLVAGSGASFADFGMHALKGVPGDWRVYRLST